MSTTASNRHARSSDNQVATPELSSVPFAIRSSTERLIRVVQPLLAEHHGGPSRPLTPASEDTDLSSTSSASNASSPRPSPSRSPSSPVPESPLISPDVPPGLESTTHPCHSDSSTLSDLLASSGPKRKRSITHFQGIPISMLPPPTSPAQCNAKESQPPRRVTTKTHAHIGGRKVVVLRRVMDLDHALERLSLNRTRHAASLIPTQGSDSQDAGDVDDSDDADDDDDVTILL